MPFEFTDHETPSGRPYLRVDASGKVGLADSQEFAAELRKRGPPPPMLLAVIAKGTEYSPEARKAFKDVDGAYSSAATVITSPLVRAAINLMDRFAAPKKSSHRMFTDEASALAWLEQQRFIEPS